MGVRGLVCAVVVAGIFVVGHGEPVHAGCNANLAWQDRYPSWAGMHIAFQREEVGCGGSESVAVVSLRTGAVQRLLRASTHPEISTQGLVAASNGRIVVADVRRGLDEFEQGAAPAWSPDGGRIAFLRNGELWILRVDGGAERRLADAADFHPFSEAHVTTPSWSPDGQEIAFIGPGMKISVARADGSGVRKLTSGLDRQVSPAWSPDGGRIAFVSDRADSWDIWSIKPDGTGTQRLTDRQQDETLPAWSPNGGRIAYIQATGESYGEAVLRTMGRDGTDPSTVGADAHGFSQPAWSSDGQKLVYASGRECLRWGLYVIDFKKAAQQRVTNPCRFVGTTRDDRVTGTPFLDFLVGKAGDDVLRGLAGRDRLTGGVGRDVLEGGEGADMIVARDGRRDVLRGGPGNDSARVDRGLDQVSGVEKLVP